MNDIFLKTDSENIHDKKTVKMQIKGDVILQNLNSIFPEIIANIDKHDNIHLILNEITELDLSAIQLIYSIKKTCDSNNKKFELVLELPEEIELLLKNSGFEKIVNTNI